jgi:hypothetical protein
LLVADIAALTFREAIDEECLVASFEGHQRPGTSALTAQRMPRVF